METNRILVGCHTLAVVALAAGTAAMLGCGASLPPPNTEWAAAQADVGRAQAGGAPVVPAAKLHLQLAQEDLTTSKELFDRDNRRAATLVALARTEAQLALSLSKESVAQNEASAAQDTLAKSTGRGGAMNPAIRGHRAVVGTFPIIIASLVAGLGACAATRMPTRELTDARDEVLQAR